jgi:hypothetical protein
MSTPNIWASAFLIAFAVVAPCLIWADAKRQKRGPR